MAGTAEGMSCWHVKRHRFAPPNRHLNVSLSRRSPCWVAQLSPDWHHNSGRSCGDSGCPADVMSICPCAVLAACHSSSSLSASVKHGYTYPFCEPFSHSCEHALRLCASPQDACCDALSIPVGDRMPTAVVCTRTLCQSICQIAPFYCYIWHSAGNPAT